MTATAGGPRRQPPCELRSTTLNGVCCACPDRRALRQGARRIRPYGTCVNPAGHDEAARAGPVYLEPDRSSVIKQDEQETAGAVMIDTFRRRPRQDEFSLSIPLKPPPHRGSTRSLGHSDLKRVRALFTGHEAILLLCEAEIHTLTARCALGITSLPETEHAVKHVEMTKEPWR